MEMNVAWVRLYFTTELLDITENIFTYTTTKYTVKIHFVPLISQNRENTVSKIALYIVSNEDIVTAIL